MKKRNFGLDIVRMCAILLVVVCHFFSIAVAHPPKFLSVAGGFGVGVFFVLSGFLIGGIILRNFVPGMSYNGIKIFYLRRWMRTLPLYWFFFIATMFCTVGGVKIDSAFDMHCLLYLVFLQNLAWPLIAPWYHESWSLAVEEVFYLIFPMLFLLMPFRTTKTRVLCSAIVMALTSFLVRNAAFAYTGNGEIIWHGIVIFRLDGIAIGIFAVLANERYGNFIARHRGLACLAGVLGTVFCYLCLLDLFSIPQWFTLIWHVVASVCIALAMLALQAFDWRHADSFPASVVSWISTRSYSLYLCHGSIIKLLLAYGWMWKGLHISIPLFILLAILVAELAYRFIEQPFMRLRPHEKQHTVARTVARTVYSVN